MKTRSLMSVAVICILVFANGLAAERGVGVRVKNLAGDFVAGNQWLVLIAVNKYKQWPPLKNPVKDAKELRQILESRYFVDNVVELFDEQATKAGIVDLFERLQREVKTHDSLLILYAGHGHLDKASETGFWIPYDGGTNTKAQENWLPNNQIRGYIKNIEARHIALATDACFSGDILNVNRSILPTITNSYFAKAYGKVARQVLTSGASETVPDESEFVMQLKLALKGNSKPYLDMLMLFSEIRTGVRDTQPMFGDLKGTGHQDGASFILFLKQHDGEEQAGVRASVSPRNDAADPDLGVERHETHETAVERRTASFDAQPQPAKTFGLVPPSAQTQSQARAAYPVPTSAPPTVSGGKKGCIRRSRDERFCDHGDGTVTDSKTGLMWTRKDSANDTSALQESHFYGSKRHVARLRTGGYSDWRIPSSAEYRAICEIGKSTLARGNQDVMLDPIFESGGLISFWTSDQGPNNSIMVVTFNGCQPVAMPPDTAWAGVRAVRNGR